MSFCHVTFQYYYHRLILHLLIGKFLCINLMVTTSGVMISSIFQLLNIWREIAERERGGENHSLEREREREMRDLPESRDLLIPQLTLTAAGVIDSELRSPMLLFQLDIYIHVYIQECHHVTENWAPLVPTPQLCTHDAQDTEGAMSETYKNLCSRALSLSLFLPSAPLPSLISSHPSAPLLVIHQIYHRHCQHIFLCLDSHGIRPFI